MPVPLKSKVTGAEETVKNIKTFMNEIQRETMIAMSQVVEKVTFDARSAAPYLTGYLRDHITGKTLRKRVWVVGTIMSSAKYSFYQEFGTSKMAAHPFLRPALQQNRGFIIDKFGTHYRETVMKSEYKYIRARRVF